MMPAGNGVPVGWSSARVEEYGEKKIVAYYLYTCQDHKIAIVKRQADLFTGEATT